MTNRLNLIVPKKGSTGAAYISSSISSAQEVQLPAGTQIIEVQADFDGVYVKYGNNGVATACTPANSDEHVQAGTTRHYEVDQNDGEISIIGQSANAEVHIYFKRA
jgi:hypothetical protein